MRIGEMCLKLRETYMEEEVFVTARESDRLIDYRRYKKMSYQREQALADFRLRFPVSQLDWTDGTDYDLLMRLFSLRATRPRTWNLHKEAV